MQDYNSKIQFKQIMICYRFYWQETFISDTNVSYKEIQLDKASKPVSTTTTAANTTTTELIKINLNFECNVQVT